MNSTFIDKQEAPEIETIQSFSLGADEGPHVGFGLHGTITPCQQLHTCIESVACLVYVECVHGASLLLLPAGCCKLLRFSGLQLAACTLSSSCWLIILSRPPALEEGVVGGTLRLFHRDTNVVSHQLPFGCVEVMCVVV